MYNVGMGTSKPCPPSIHMKIAAIYGCSYHFIRLKMQYQYSLALQIPAEKVFRPQKTIPNTVSEAVWSSRDWHFRDERTIYWMILMYQ